jgi:hypothetical protein
MVSNGLGMDREIVCHIKKISIEEAKLMQQTHSILAQEGVETEKKVKSSIGGKSSMPSQQKPKITLQSLTPAEVHHRSGFQDLKHLLSYTVIVYGGNLNEMVDSILHDISWLRDSVDIRVYIWTNLHAMD